MNETTRSVPSWIVAYDHGRECHRQSECENPYPEATEEHRWWDIGWNKSNEELARWEDNHLRISSHE